MSDSDFSSDYSSDDDTVSIVPVLIIKQTKSVRKTANRKKINTSGCKTFVNILKNNVFFTDIARGKLVYKDENETKMATMAESFILDCISRSKIECLIL